jgi:hypothetical protein
MTESELVQKFTPQELAHLLVNREHAVDVFFRAQGDALDAMVEQRRMRENLEATIDRERAEWAKEREGLERFRAAIEKINDIRNSIVGLQKLNWSEHIYPLVAALNEAGMVGMEYPEARGHFVSLLERANRGDEIEARLTAAESRAASAEDKPTRLYTPCLVCERAILVIEEFAGCVVCPRCQFPRDPCETCGSKHCDGSCCQCETCFEKNNRSASLNFEAWNAANAVEPHPAPSASKSDPVQRLENLMDGLADHVESMTDEEILADAKARGVPLDAQLAGVKSKLLETARQTRAAKARPMADPALYKGGYYLDSMREPTPSHLTAIAAVAESLPTDEAAEREIGALVAKAMGEVRPMRRVPRYPDEPGANVMDAPNGPICACGLASRWESGWCGEKCFAAPDVVSRVDRPFGAAAAVPEATDNPDTDGTDAAHPAWWRGEKTGSEGVARALHDVAIRGAIGTFGSDVVEEAAQAIDALRYGRDALARKVEELETENKRYQNAIGTVAELMGAAHSEVSMERDFAKEDRDAALAKLQAAQRAEVAVSEEQLNADVDVDRKHSSES